MKSIKVIVPILALLAVCLFYWPERPTYIPKKLWGVWQTDQEAYADRYLDISEAVFTIGQGQQGIEVFFIQQVKMERIDQRERYTLYYRKAGSTKEPLQTFSFFYRKTEKGERLQLQHPGDILWHRRADQEPTPSTPETATS